MALCLRLKGSNAKTIAVHRSERTYQLAALSLALTTSRHSHSAHFDFGDLRL